jgi:hypothetical protein
LWKWLADQRQSNGFVVLLHLNDDDYPRASTSSQDLIFFLIGSVSGAMHVHRVCYDCGSFFSDCNAVHELQRLIMKWFCC